MNPDPDVRQRQARGRRLAALRELPEGRLCLRTLGSRRFLVVRRGEAVHVCGDTCPHRGAALHEGLLLQGEIVCPCHQARFDSATGGLAGPPARDDLPSYAVEVADGQVFVGPPRPAAAWHRSRGGEQRRVLILGAGAAGSAAAEGLRREGFSGRICLLGAEPELPYDRTVLSKRLLSAHEGEDGETLELRPEEFYRQAEIELLLGCRAAAVDPSRRRVRLDTGRELAYDWLLLASGGAARRLGLPGEELPGCLTLRGRRDALHIGRAAAGGRRAVILGAGFIGLELAGVLRERGLEVTVVAPEGLPLEDVVGPRIGRWLLRRHQERGVRFLLGSTAREIRGGPGVQELWLADGRLLSAELVVEAVGILPEVRYLEGTGLVRNGAVPVDPQQRTAAPGVLAAGDIAAVTPTGSAGSGRRFEHWVEAERQGLQAARSIVGRGGERGRACADTDGGSPRDLFFWSEQAGLTLKSVGDTRGAAAAALRGDPEAGSFLAAYVAGDRLAGACAVGRDRELIALSPWVGRRLPLATAQLADEGVDLVEELYRRWPEDGSRRRRAGGSP